MNLDELLLALRSGEPGAREQFGRAVQAELQRFFSNCFGPADTAELTQQTFLVAWEKLETFESLGSGSFERWLYAIAGNKARAHQQAPSRQYARHDKLREHQALASPQTSAGTRILRDQQRELFERCLAELPTDDREIIEHTLAEGDDRELAEAEGIKSASVRSRRHRANRKMRRLVDAKRKTPDTDRSPLPS